MSWMPIKNYCQFHPWPTESSLRWLIWKHEKLIKGQLPFVRRYGKRVLIEDQKFQDWIGSEEFKKEKWTEKDEFNEC